MPKQNQFRHQNYTSDPPKTPYFLMTAQRDAFPVPEADEFKARVEASAKVLRENNVARLLLVHGTFVGEDAFGALGNLERLVPNSKLVDSLFDRIRDQFPELATIRQINKRFKDAIRDDFGNYTKKYAAKLQDSLTDSTVERVYWSSENHHVGRVRAAVEYLHDLFKNPVTKPARLMYWGHSHAGNVFAIMTNLLANHRPSVERFFEAGQIYFRDNEKWGFVRDTLANSPSPCPIATQLDFVTFGTPIRYGWDQDGYGNLMHFVNHRPGDNAPEYLVSFPRKPNELFQGTYGDVTHLLGVAGSDFAPIFGDKYWANRRLTDVLEAGLAGSDDDQSWLDRLEDRRLEPHMRGLVSLPKRLQTGMRVPNDGITLLVDYVTDRATGMGHAVYTRLAFLLFHTEKIAHFLYGDAVA